jgi:ribonucleotide reductase beta subunit family protein with ferritin-like domain
MSIITASTDDVKRFVIGKIEYNDIWQMYKKAVNSFWVTDEIDLTTDITDWNDKLTDNEKHFIKYVLAFFANSDGIVMENLVTNFYIEIKNQTAKQFYAFQIAIEAIHAETYNEIINTLIKDDNEKEELFRAIEEIPVIKKKGDWALKWFDTANNFSTRVFAFSIVEGLFFSASFAAIYYLKKKNLMKGVGQSNELISRDEGLHTEFAQLIYNKYSNPDDRLSQEKAYEIMQEAVDYESEFITKSLPVDLIGINSNLMIQYI